LEQSGRNQTRTRFKTWRQDFQNHGGVAKHPSTGRTEEFKLNFPGVAVGKPAPAARYICRKIIPKEIQLRQERHIPSCWSSRFSVSATCAS
jgi:hypothetical protein